MTEAKIITESSIENPLGFFEYYFFYNGYVIFYERFFSGLEDFYDFVENINKEEDYIDYYRNNSEGIDKVRRDYFKDSLKSILETQISVSISYIEQSINICLKDKMDIPDYLRILIGKLNRLTHEIKNNKEFSKYPFPLESLYRLVFLLHTTYNPFFNEIQSNCIKEALSHYKNQAILLAEVKDIKSDSHNKLEKEKQPIKAFKWLSEPMRNTMLFHHFLKTMGVIDKDVPVNIFESAFNGAPLSEPLKIRWNMKTRNINNTKPSLIRIFRLLMYDLNLLEHKSKTGFASTLETIFVDSTGAQIRNIKNSQSQIKDEGDPLEKELKEGIMALFPARTAISSSIP